MGGRVILVWEGYEVDATVADDVLGVQGAAYRLTYLLEVYLRQASLRREAACIDELNGLELICRAHQCHNSIWFNQEVHSWIA